MTAPKISVEDLDRIVLKSLQFSYTSRSCKDQIATGNWYQSVALGDSEHRGFRSSRSQFFDLLDFTNKRVLDIGCNIGEMSRSALKRGASYVHGVEYEPLFVLQADLISLRNGVPADKYCFEHADVTKQFKFANVYDFVLAFSVFTYIEHRLLEIANATREALLLETHQITDEWEKIYIKPLSRSFPLIVMFGVSDWGLAEQFAHGRRFVLGCFKTKAAAWSALGRMQELAPNLSTMRLFDIQASDIPALRHLKQDIADGILEKISDLTGSTSVASMLSRPEPLSLADATYWLEFYRGYKSFRQADNTLADDNPYLSVLNAMVSRGSNFDPGAFAQMKDKEATRQRVAARFRNFMALETMKAPEEFKPIPMALSLGGEKQAIELHVVGNTSRIKASRIDGYHRLGAALLAGVKCLPGYHLQTFGAL